MLFKLLRVRHFKTQLLTFFGGLIAFWLAVVGGYFVGEEAGAVVNNRGEALYSTAGRIRRSGTGTLFLSSLTTWCGFLLLSHDFDSVGMEC